jgi:tetratricopeptide (TPR) repeat protein/predicted Ser/Thr protein kinase
LSPEEPNAEQLRRTQEIFHDLLSVVPERREALLLSRCNGDDVLIAELRSLLAACEAEEALVSVLSIKRSPGPRRVDRYTLDQLLGRGGMGAVYLAHRVDGQFEQQVAIKLIDLPLATDMFRDRFLQERQILAGLVHPYIAHLLDGGITDAGEPFLAMEYVEGISITQYCSQHSLSLTQRLQLFRHVCSAVQFAHQNLVVHRDLKPDNILVVNDGTPRLLDFGTAKLLASVEDGRAAEWTRQGLPAFTPQYASPEQVLGEPITTATDIYSLGVLLYLLVAEVPPYELHEFSTAEMLRVICNEPPPKPSTRASGKRLDSDIDAIVMKALRKEPAQRYATVDLLSTDIEAYLTGHPVQAERGSFRYVAGKFIRRNRVSLLAACLLALTLVAGVAGVLWQWREADLQRRRAEARTADLRELSNSLLTELDAALKDIPGSTGAQKLLITRVLEHLDHSAKDAHGDRQSDLDLIDAYTRLGDVQGNSYANNLADSAGALSSFDKALALAKPLVDANPHNPQVLRALASATEERGETLSTMGRTDESVAALRSAAETYEHLVTLPSTTPKLMLEASTAIQTLGDELCQDDGLADAQAGLTAYRRSLALDERAIQMDPTYLPARRGPAYMHLHIGNVQLDTNPAEALKEFQLALQVLDSLPPEDQQKLLPRRLHATLVRKEGAAFMEMGMYSRAIPLFEQSQAIYQRFLDADPDGQLALGDMHRLLDVEATSYEYAADPSLAEGNSNRRQNLQIAAQLLERNAAITRKLQSLDTEHGEWDAELASILTRIEGVEAKLNPTSSPSANYRDALATLKRIADQPHASPADLDLAASAFMGKLPPSPEDSTQAVVWAQRAVDMTHHRSAGLLLLLAETCRANGQKAKAILAAREGLALAPANLQPPGKVRVWSLLKAEANE